MIHMFIYLVMVVDAWAGHKIVPGTQFQFEYKSVVVNSVPSLSKDGNGLKFKMTLVFTQADGCWLVLNVTDVMVYYYKGNWPRISEEDYVLDPSLTAIYSEALTQFALWHQVQAGSITCIQWHIDEPLWVRNFKRGVLTNFQQNSRPSEIWETGITGTCRVKQTVDRRKDKYVTTKVYDTSSCIDRPQQIKSPIELNPQLNPINSNLFSLSRSSRTTVEYLEHLYYMLTSILVQEQHDFKPFGRFKGGPVVSTRQEYKLLRDLVKFVDVPQFPFDACHIECSSLLFEYEEPTLNITECPIDLVDEASELIRLMSCNWAQPEQIQYGRQFLELVILLRKACWLQLETLWGDTRDMYEYEVAKPNEIYIDALSQVGTDQSVKFLIEKILSGSLTVQHTSLIMADMYFYNKKTYSMLKQIQRLAEANWASIFRGQEPYVLKDLQYQSWLLLGSTIQDVEIHHVKRVSLHCLPL
jgi:hypothetical protein